MDRGLTAILASLIRLEAEDFNAEEGAGKLQRDHAIIQSAIEAISVRAERISGSKEIGHDVRLRLKNRIDEWLKLIEKSHEAGSKVFYNKDKQGTARPLLRKAETGRWEMFTCLNSLRDVETPVRLILGVKDIPDGPSK